MKFPNALLFSAASLLLANPSLAHTRAGTGEAERIFESAVQAFANEEYAEAATLYEFILSRGLQSAPVYHNLALAYARLEQPGKAIFYFERSLLLNPWQPAVRREIETLHRTIRLSAPETPLHRIFSRMLSPDLWTLLASLGLWLGLALWIVPPLLPRPRTPAYAAGSFVLALALLASLAAYDRHRERSTGIVILPDTALKVAPTTDSPLLGEAPEGLRLNFSRHERGHYYVTTPVGRSGWVHESRFAPIAPDRAMLPPPPPEQPEEQEEEEDETPKLQFS